MKKYAYLASMLLAPSIFTPVYAAYRCCPEPIEEEILIQPLNQEQQIEELIESLQDSVNPLSIKRLSERSKAALLHIAEVIRGILNAIAHKDHKERPEFAQSINSTVAGITNIILLGAESKKSKKAPKEMRHLTRKIERIVRLLIEQAIDTTKVCSIK